MVVTRTAAALFAPLPPAAAAAAATTNTNLPVVVDTTGWMGTMGRGVSGRWLVGPVVVVVVMMVTLLFWSSSANGALVVWPPW